MNKQRRKRLEEASALLEQAKEILEEAKDEEEEAYENLPEGLQSSERGDVMREARPGRRQAARYSFDRQYGKRLLQHGRGDRQYRTGGGVDHGENRHLRRWDIPTVSRAV